MSRVNVCRTMAILWVAVSFAGKARALEIEHQPAACAFADRHPRIEARLQGAGAGAALRVFFHRTESRDWYGVSMRREAETWSATLPAPQAGVRFGYFITAWEAEQDVRVPQGSAFVVDASAACDEAALPVSDEGRVELQVPPGAPQVPAGFARSGIRSFVEYTTDLDMPPAGAVARAGAYGVPEGTRVRIRLTGLGPDRGIVEGTVASWGAEGPLLSIRGKGTRRLGHDDIATLEIRQPGSPAMSAVGGLAGAGAGFIGALLICVSGDGFCGGGVAPLWIGTGVGMVAGIAAGGASTWKRVPVARRGAFALEMERPRQGAAAVGLSVRF